MIKLIFSDMDGTLMDENDRLPTEFATVMEKLLARGVTFVPASGRQVYSLMDTFPDYRDKFLFIGDNGTLIAAHGEIIYSNVVERQEALATVNAVNQMDGIYNVYCGKQSVYLLKSKHPEVHMDEIGKYFSRIQLVDSFAEVEDEPVKMSFFTPDADAETKILPLMRQQHPDKQVVLASAYWVDVTNRGANKGTAVKEIQRRFGIKPEECAAFGDYMNDKEMLQSVAYSYAMANAYPEIKQVARFMAPSNAEHGVMRQIEEFLAEGLC